MKKFLVDESQKEEILKKHEDFKKSLSETVIKRIYNSKKILKEQSDPIFIDNRTIEQVKADCVTDPTVKAIVTSIQIKGKKIPGIKVNGGPDNVRIYTNEKNEMFGGYNWYVLNTPETKILKGPFKWTCSPKKGPDPNAGDIENLIKSGVWFKKEDLVKQGVTLDELTDNYEKHKSYDLYKPKNSSNKRTSGFNPKQQSFVNKWENASIENTQIPEKFFKINPTDDDFAGGQFRENYSFTAPNSTGTFGTDGLKVYYNGSQVTERLSRENCRVKIKDFADKYKLRNDRPQTAQWIAYNRIFVQQCANKFKFGGPLSNIDNDLNLVGGMIVGGAGNGTEWHIKLSKKL
jgi:hypothetical protein